MGIERLSNMDGMRIKCRKCKILKVTVLDNEENRERIRELEADFDYEKNLEGRHLNVSSLIGK